MKTFLVLTALLSQTAFAEGMQSFSFLTRGGLANPGSTVYGKNVRDNARAVAFGCAVGDTASPESFEASIQLTTQKPRLKVFNNVKARSFDSKGSCEYGTYQQYAHICGKSELVLTRMQGIDPVLRLFANNPRQRPTHYKVDCWNRDDGYHSPADMFSLKDPAYLRSNTAIEISFKKLSKGGKNLRLSFRIGSAVNDSYYPSYNLDYKNDKRTWEGDFKFEHCKTKDGQNVTDLNSKATSLSDILARDDEDFLPGFVNCTYSSQLMASADVGHWATDDKIVIPTLRNIKLVVSTNSADVYFEAFNGIKYEQQEIPLISKDDLTSDIALAKAEEIYEILRGALPYMAQYQTQNSLPHVVGYLTKQKPLLLTKLVVLNTLLEKTSFFTALNITNSLSNFYQDLDKAVGLISNGTVRVADVLEIN